MATETEKAYAAGLIDGEGCIGATYGEYVQKLKDMKRPAANRLPV